MAILGIAWIGTLISLILTIKDLQEIEKRLEEKRFKEYQRQQIEKEEKRTHPIQEDEAVARFIDDYMATPEKDSHQ